MRGVKKHDMICRIKSARVFGDFRVHLRLNMRTFGCCRNVKHGDVTVKNFGYHRLTWHVGSASLWPRLAIASGRSTHKAGKAVVLASHQRTCICDDASSRVLVLAHLPRGMLA